ncbi:MAG: glycosyltransferase family 87 protein, partial [Nanoarchaeota archaeon]|nr:glycosyltransferase family 87 protein [Nanoarchaeota archaeon]
MKNQITKFDYFNLSSLKEKIEKNQILSGCEAITNLKIYQVGVIVFLLVLIFGYLDFRIQGEGIYNDGQSGFAALPKGMDFKAVHTYAVLLRSSFDNYSSQNSIYTPFVTIAYLPLSFFPANIAYKIFCIILLCFLFSLVYALLSEKGNLIIQCKNRGTCKIILSLLIVYILFQTYPVNFAFERGNYDIIAASFAVFSLLAMTKKSVIVSAGLLAISTQLKIYPAILIIMLFARFGWKSVWYFVLFNVLLLFTLGIPGFEKFVSTMSEFAVKPLIPSINHSFFS